MVKRPILVSLQRLGALQEPKFLNDYGLAESQLLTEGLINYSNLTFDLTLMQQRSEI